MPQPLGKSIAKVEREERDADEAIRRRREKNQSRGDTSDDLIRSHSRRTSTSGRGYDTSSAEAEDGPPGWMTAATAAALAALTWSFVGLTFSEDPAMGPPLTPEQIAEMTWE